MTTVTFSDLRNQAKKYFDAVRQGESLEVLWHGKPIAIVSPVTRRGVDFLKRIKPLKIPGLSLSKELLADRAESR